MVCAQSAGLDSAELVSQLRAAHAEGGGSRAGVDVIEGRMGDMQQLGIFEAFKVCTPSNQVSRRSAGSGCGFPSSSRSRPPPQMELD